MSHCLGCNILVFICHWSSCKVNFLPFFHLFSFILLFLNCEHQSHFLMTFPKFPSRISESSESYHRGIFFCWFNEVYYCFFWGLASPILHLLTSICRSPSCLSNTISTSLVYQGVSSRTQKIKRMRQDLKIWFLRLLLWALTQPVCTGGTDSMCISFL